MREKRRKEKKSHNVGKAGKNAVRQGNDARRKRMTVEERSAQVDKQIRIIVLTVIFIVIVITAIFVYKSKVGEKGYNGQTDQNENGEYIGEREIDIRELSYTEMEEEKLPEFDLYEETNEKSLSDRFKSYKEAVREIIYPANVRSSDVLDDLSDDDQNQWNALYDKIEREERKKGNTENVAELQKLSSAEYRDIYELCYQAYRVLPQGDMATRYGRNAGDALITGLEENVDVLQLNKDFHISNEGYVTSFHYRDREQKLADGCYWAGNNFYQSLKNNSELTEQEREHCALTAYFYAFYGDEVSGEEGVQHRNDLKEMKEETSRILMEEYDYPAFLFSEGYEGSCSLYLNVLEYV